MKKLYIFITLCLISISSWAGNKDRVGQAGASELLINPWARSGGLQFLGQASVRGIESSKLNIAGLAYVNKLDLTIARSIYWAGSGISVTAVGTGIRLGENGGTLGLDIMTMGFGEIQVTTTDMPDGGLGNYKPQFMNIGLSYARQFSNSISGGFTLRGVTERVSNVGASGICLDAGIQYLTGKKENVHFGIALKNVGGTMRFSGDGLSVKSEVIDDNYGLINSYRAEKFELPTALSIGGAYDFLINKETDNVYMHKITIHTNYLSNSFSKDVWGAGLEYAFRNMFMFKAGYSFEPGITNQEERSTIHTGISAGVGFDIPIKKDGPRFGLDYAFKTTQPYGGTHTLGLKLNL